MSQPYKPHDSGTEESSELNQHKPTSVDTGNQIIVGFLGAVGFVFAEVMFVYYSFAHTSETVWLRTELLALASWIVLSGVLSVRLRALGIVMGILGLLGSIFPYFLGVAGFGGL